MDLNDINSHQWTKNLPNPASPQQMRAWQDRLDTVCGTEPDGTPRLRLVWLPDWNTQRTWDRYKGEWTLKYVWGYRTEHLEGEGLSGVRYEPIAPPRFAIEALVPASAQSVPAGFDRPGVDKEWVEDEAGQLQEVITAAFHEMRESGPRYTRIEFLCQHSELRHPDSGRRACCHELLVERNERCLGRYRPFDDLDVQRMRRLFRQKLEQSKGFRPDVPLTSEFRRHVFASWSAQLATQRAREDVALQAELDKQQADLVKTFSQLALPGAKKNRFSIPGI